MIFTCHYAKTHPHTNTDNVYFDHANQKIEDTIIERKTDEGASHPSSHIFMFFSTPEGSLASWASRACDASKVVC